MPGLAGDLPNVYSIQQLDIYKTSEGLLKARRTQLDEEVDKKKAEEARVWEPPPSNWQFKRAKNSLPPGVILVSPREKTGSFHVENRVAPSTLAHKHSPSRCSQYICRYHQDKFHKKFNKSQLSNQPNHINIYERIVYPETEVLKMEKIANFRERVSVSHVEMPRKDIWKSLGAEFIGTFVLIFLGAGCGLYLDEKDKIPLVGGALCWGLTVATLAQALGHVSGCHINPAVTLAMLFTRKIELVKSGLYILTQCIAGITSIAVLKALTPDNTKGPYGVMKVAGDLTELQGFAIEFITTFILIFTIFAVSDDNRNDVQGSTPLAIGLCVAALILFSGPLTGAGLNPARALGPAVMMNDFESHWVYWLGPIGGAITAAAVYEHIFRNMRPEEIEAAELAKQLKLRENEANNASSPPV